MRMRKKKNGAARRAALQYLLLDTANGICGLSNVVNLIEKNGATLPPALEIGCGKGDFICGMAQKEPQRLFVGVERVPDVALIAMEKAAAQNLNNVRFLIGNAALLGEWFAPRTFSAIYLNFSDPWPKAGHAKRRLTHPNFLKIFETLLIPNGVIQLKTDNRQLFDYSLEQFENMGYICDEITYDLYASSFLANNVPTEYETKFSAAGYPIHRVLVHVPSTKPQYHQEYRLET